MVRIARLGTPKKESRRDHRAIGSRRSLQGREPRRIRDVLSRGRPGDAPVVLLLHGFPTSSHMFRDLIPYLADRFHVIAPDLPGFGQSAAPTARNSLTPLMPLLNSSASC